MQKIIEVKMARFSSRKKQLLALNKKVEEINSEGWRVKSFESHKTPIGLVVSYLVLIERA